MERKGFSLMKSYVRVESCVVGDFRVRSLLISIFIISYHLMYADDTEILIRKNLKKNLK